MHIFLKKGFIFVLFIALSITSQAQISHDIGENASKALVNNFHDSIRSQQSTRDKEIALKKKKRIEELTEKYGAKYALHIANGNIIKGMTKAMVLEAINTPESKNIRKSNNYTHEQWVYRYYKKTKYIYFKNDIVTSVSENEML